MSKRTAAEIEAHLAAPVAGQLKLDLAVGSREALFSRPRGRRARRRGGQSLPAGVVYVGRPSAYGNPFRCDGTASARRQAVEQYRAYLLDRPNLVDLVRAELGGLDLACWCPLDGGACHAEDLLDLAASPGTPAAAVLLAA